MAESARENSNKLAEFVTKDGEVFDIIKVSPDDISDENSQELIENLIENNFQYLKIPDEESKMKLRDEVLAIREKIKAEGGEISDDIPDPNSIYPNPTRGEHIRGAIRTLKELIEKGTLLAAKKDDKIVSILGYKIFGEMPPPDSRVVYEFTKASTLKAFGHKGIASELEKQLIKIVSEKNPNSSRFAMSRNPNVKKSKEGKDAWKEVKIFEDEQCTIFSNNPLVEILRKKVNDDNYIRNMIKNEGYKCYFMDRVEDLLK